MFIEIHQLKGAGCKKSEVARRLDLNRKTVTKYWDMEPEDFHGALNQAENRKR